jgi:hypothetical protein
MGELKGELMGTKAVDVVHRSVVKYACGCTTTRITVRRAAEGEATPILCAAHRCDLIEKEERWEYKEAEPDDRS